MNSNKLKWIPEAIQFGVDAESGCVVEQLTSDAVLSNNIYCEQRYATADGSIIAFIRHPFGRPVEIWICKMNSLRIAKVVEGVPCGANSKLNVIYYQVFDDDHTNIMRLDLLTLESSPVLRLPGREARAGSVSPDERRFLYGPFASADKEGYFSMKLIDLETGRSEIICEIKDLFNPHVQFNLGNSDEAMLQINRGGVKDPSRDMSAMVGPLGATLYHLNVRTGDVTPLAAGRPWTPGCTGHETWIASTGEIAFTACHVSVSPSSHVSYCPPPQGEEWMPPSAIYGVKLGDAKPRIIAQGLLFNHIAISDDGKYFIAEDNLTMRIHVGSVATGRYLGLCDSYTRQGSCQHSHVHPYMTPDNRFVIFNSIVTGVPQIYAARIPDGFLGQLD